MTKQNLVNLIKKEKGLNFFSEMKKKFPHALIKTDDDKSIFDGGFLFELKATHGLPLEMALDKIINEHNYAVDWVGFIEAARKNKMWDFQTHKLIEHALVDAQIPKLISDEIILRFKLYVMKYPLNVNDFIK